MNEEEIMHLFDFSFVYRAASLAVNGDDSPYISSGPQSCTHTNFDDPPWFVVDLGKEEGVIGVAITNRDVGSMYSLFI